MRLIVAIVLALFLSPVHAAVEESPEAIETTIDLRLMHALLEAQLELVGEEWEPPEKPVTIREFSRNLSREIARRVVRKDAWGNEFMVFGLEQDLLVVSSGADGVHDALRSLQQTEQTEQREMEVEDMLRDDILLVLSEGVVNGPISPKDGQRRTMADLRSIGTAIESFSIDNNVYPRQDRDLLPVELIQDRLSPVYIRTLPLKDAWGNEFLMWGTEGEYVIISLGADGAPDQYYGFTEGNTMEFPFRRATSKFNDDIIFANGQFVQWPEGTQQ